VEWANCYVCLPLVPPTQRLLPLTYLLFLLRYDEYVPDTLNEFVTQIRLSFPQENQTTWKPPIPYNIRKGGDGGSNNNNQRDDGDGDNNNDDNTNANILSRPVLRD
jgi:hypothetical protein